MERRLFFFGRFGQGRSFRRFYPSAAGEIFRLGLLSLAVDFFRFGGRFFGFGTEENLPHFFLGAVLFVAAGLGLIDIVFPDKGGLVGNLIGYLEVPFGQIASIVVIVVALAASF